MPTYTILIRDPVKKFLLSSPDHERKRFKSHFDKLGSNGVWPDGLEANTRRRSPGLN